MSNQVKLTTLDIIFSDLELTLQKNQVCPSSHSKYSNKKLSNFIINSNWKDKIDSIHLPRVLFEKLQKQKGCSVKSGHFGHHFWQNQTMFVMVDFFNFRQMCFHFSAVCLQFFK